MVGSRRKGKNFNVNLREIRKLWHLENKNKCYLQMKRNVKQLLNFENAIAE